MNADDAARELDKAADALDAAAKHLRARNQSDAALHMAERVRPSPLTVAVENAAEQARKAAGSLREQGGV